MPQYMLTLIYPLIKRGQAMTVYNAPAVKLSHEETVAAIEFYDNWTKRLMRAYAVRNMELTTAREKAVIRGADDMLLLHFGFRVRDMFATTA